MSVNEKVNYSKLVSFGFLNEASVVYIHYKVLFDEQTNDNFGTNKKPFHFALFNKVLYEKVKFNPVTSQHNKHSFKFNLADAVRKLKDYNEKNSYLLYRNQILDLQNISKIYYSWDERGKEENSIKFVGYLKLDVYEKFKKSYEKSVRSEFGI